MSSGVCLIFVGIIVLRDSGVTNNAVAFTLALLVMKAEGISHKIVQDHFPIIFGLIPVLIHHD